MPPSKKLIPALASSIIYQPGLLYVMPSLCHGERQRTETPTRQVSSLMLNQPRQLSVLSIVSASTAKASKILSEHASALSAKSSASLATSTTSTTITAKPPLRSAPATSSIVTKVPPTLATSCDLVLFSRQEDPVISNYIPEHLFDT